jgi:hypothetical protein
MPCPPCESMCLGHDVRMLTIACACALIGCVHQHISMHGQLCFLGTCLLPKCNPQLPRCEPPPHIQQALNLIQGFIVDLPHTRTHTHTHTHTRTHTSSQACYWKECNLLYLLSAKYWAGQGGRAVQSQTTRTLVTSSHTHTHTHIHTHKEAVKTSTY